MDRHARLMVWLGLLVTVLLTYGVTYSNLRISPAGVQSELTKKEDIHNLYYAARQARWRDIPGWWVGSWIYPDVGYYRPLTSVLFFAEYRLFDRDFTAYNRVSAHLHTINICLLYLLTISLFRNRRLLRILYAWTSVYFFGSGANTMFFAVWKALGWWPAQNDLLSLLFCLLSLLLLDEYLVRALSSTARSRKGWLFGSLVSFYLAIASKEMGFIVGPLAILLILYRRAASAVEISVAERDNSIQEIEPKPERIFGLNRILAPTLTFAVLTIGFWKLRKLLIPKEWGPDMFRAVILHKGMVAWLGPPYYNADAGTKWPALSTFATLLVGAIGLKKRWRMVTVVTLSLTAGLVVTQFAEPEAGIALIMISASQQLYFSCLMYFLGLALFWKYRQVEPGLLCALMLCLVYVPILQYGGPHYYYWPGAFNGLMNAAFLACLVRWAFELRDTANWTLPEWMIRMWNNNGVESRES